MLDTDIPTATPTAATADVIDVLDSLYCDDIATVLWVDGSTRLSESNQDSWIEATRWIASFHECAKDALEFAIISQR